MTDSEEFARYENMREHRNKLLAKLRLFDGKICEEYGLGLGDWSSILRHYDQDHLDLIDKCVDAGVTFMDKFKKAFEQEKLNRAVEDLLVK